MYPTIDRIETGKRIKRLMEERNVSVREVKEYLGLTCVQSIYHWLDGRTLPNLDNLYALSELLHVSLDEMVCGNREISYKKNKPRINRLEKYYYKFVEYFFLNSERNQVQCTFCLRIN